MSSFSLHSIHWIYHWISLISSLTSQTEFKGKKEWILFIIEACIYLSLLCSISHTTSYRSSFVLLNHPSFLIQQVTCISCKMKEPYLSSVTWHGSNSKKDCFILTSFLIPFSHGWPTIDIFPLLLNIDFGHPQKRAGSLCVTVNYRK